MRQPAQYVATVRKVPFITFEYKDYAEVVAQQWEATTAKRHRVLPNKRHGAPFAVWEIVPRRAPAFYE